MAKPYDIQSLIKRVQKEVQGKEKGVLPLEVQLLQDLTKYRSETSRRRHDEKNWIQMTAPVTENPAVGLYINPVATKFLYLNEQGVAHVFSREEAMEKYGERALRTMSKRAVRQPPPKRGQPGEDLLKAYRAFLESPALPSKRRGRRHGGPRNKSRKIRNK